MRRSFVLPSLLMLAPVVIAAPARALAQSASGDAGAATSAAPAAASGAPATTPATTPERHPESSNNLREAQAHVVRALEHFRAHAYTEAIHEFELANSAAPSADFLYNIARAHELLSHYDEAADFYRRYLRDKVDPPDRADVEHRITELARLAEAQRAAARRSDTGARVRFEVPNPGASVFLDDRLVGRAPLTDVLSVPPGNHPVRVTADGMQEWRANLRVRQGETVTAFATLTPATRYRTRSGSHIASYIAAALGVGGFGTGIYFGAVAAGMTGGCGGDEGTGVAGPCPRRDAAVTADIFFGIGAGLLLTAAILYFVESGSSTTERIEPATPPPPLVPVRGATAAEASPAPATSAPATTTTAPAATSTTTTSTTTTTARPAPAAQPARR